jgi:hypothetical protein
MYSRIRIDEALKNHAKKTNRGKPMKKVELAELVIDRDIDIKAKMAKISNWNVGRVFCNHTDLMKLAEVLKCSTDQLLGRKEF